MNLNFSQCSPSNDICHHKFLVDSRTIINNNNKLNRNYQESDKQNLSGKRGKGHENQKLFNIYEQNRWKDHISMTNITNFSINARTIIIVNNKLKWNYCK